VFKTSAAAGEKTHEEGDSTAALLFG